MDKIKIIKIIIGIVVTIAAIIFIWVIVKSRVSDEQTDSEYEAARAALIQTIQSQTAPVDPDTRAMLEAKVRDVSADGQVAPR